MLYVLSNLGYLTIRDISTPPSVAGATPPPENQGEEKLLQSLLEVGEIAH